jgi:hypothetical protein
MLLELAPTRSPPELRGELFFLGFFLGPGVEEGLGLVSEDVREGGVEVLAAVDEREQLPELGRG